VLERGAPGDTWRTRRLRSFRIVSPNSLNLLPGYEYDGPEPDAFLDIPGLLAYLEGYAASFAAPVRSDSPVSEVRPADGGGFLVLRRIAPHVGSRQWHAARLRLGGDECRAAHRRARARERVIILTGAGALCLLCR